MLHNDTQNRKLLSTVYRLNFCIILCTHTHIYIYNLHFSDYCPHLCRHVYHNAMFIITPCLSQRFGCRTLRPSAYWGRLFLFHQPCLMDVSYQLSPVNFHFESSRLPSPGIELTLFGYVTGSPLSTVPCVLEDICVYHSKRNKGLSSTFQPPEEGWSL